MRQKVAILVFAPMFFLLIFISINCKSQEIENLYELAYLKLDSMLQEAKEPSFKEAVFIVENTFYDNSISFEEADKRIQILVSLAKNWMKFNPLKNYRFEDSATVEKNYAIYKLLKDTIFIKTRSEDTTFAHLPYTYDFDDFFAKKDWSKMFVLKLLAKHNGNCHSFPFLYKNIRKL